MIDEMNIDQWISRFYAGTLNKHERRLLIQYISDRSSNRHRDSVDYEIESFLADRELIEFRQNVARICKRYRTDSGAKPRYFSAWLVAASLMLLLATGITLLLMMNASPFIFRPGISNAMLSQAEYESDKKADQWNLQSPSWKDRGVIIARHEYGVMDQKNAAYQNNFIPNPYMESLVGVIMRSGQSTLFSPPRESFVSQGDKVRFEWKRGNGEVALIELTTNQGVCFLSKTVKTASGLSISTKDWEPGVYYWRLVVDDQLVTVGKIWLKMGTEKMKK